MEINEKLKELYNIKMELLKTPLLEYNKNSNNIEKATNPLLIQVNENWKLADFKIMIVGQETNGWCHECGNSQEFNPNINKSIEVYNNFYLKGNGYRSPFWNEFNRIRKNINPNKKVAFSWNNLIKIGKVGVGNSHKINQIKETYFNVLLEEIEILKPNCIIFFTGPNYNNFIEKYIGKNKTTPIVEFNSNELSIVEFENLNSLFCLKTYHPNYLYRSGLRLKVINKIIELINQKIE